MNKITAADTLNLSIPERIVLVEEIWDSIAADVESIELCENEKKTLNQRLISYRKNPNATSPWKKVYNEIISK